MHNVELISTGSELLSGRTLNRHGQTLGLALTELGCALVRDTTIGDDMASIGGNLGYRLLKVIAPPDRRQSSGGQSYASPNEKLRTHFGDDVFERLRGKNVIDFGCGIGREAIEISKQPDTDVVGVELRDDFREIATRQAKEAGVGENCRFVRVAETRADVVISLDAFEHSSELDAASTL